VNSLFAGSKNSGEAVVEQNSAYARDEFFLIGRLDERSIFKPEVVLPIWVYAQCFQGLRRFISAVAISNQRGVAQCACFAIGGDYHVDHRPDSAKAPNRMASEYCFVIRMGVGEKHTLSAFDSEGLEQI